MMIRRLLRSSCPVTSKSRQSWRICPAIFLTFRLSTQVLKTSSMTPSINFVSDSADHNGRRHRMFRGAFGGAGAVVTGQKV